MSTVASGMQHAHMLSVCVSVCVCVCVCVSVSVDYVRTQSHQDAVHENMDYAACLAEEKERVESLTKSLADAQAEEQRVKQHLEDLGAGEGRTLLDALQAARKARNQVKDLAAQLEAKTNKCVALMSVVPSR